MTDAERRADEIFLSAVELDGDERDRYLEETCAGDADLRARVEAMLGAEEDLPTAFLRGGESADLDASSPGQIGPYRVVREIGRGGMGVVYEAEQENPTRRVALKVVRQGLAGAEHVARFKREVHALAQLQHPGIAHIYESGSARIGEGEWPYFAMEYIDGLPLDRHAEQNALSTRHRLELVARVCDAVQHAHQRGVIHRDLKPANVLVVDEATRSRTADDARTVADAIGQPKILDFGIARFTDADVQATMQTSTGQIIGTLAYMSPEQVEGRPEALDTRVDVYALGVMLYTLASGHPPHDLAGLPIHEAARVIKEDEPTLLGAHDTTLRGDVSTIAQKAMAKERDRRYASAAELAEDIRRHLRHEPISAAPPSTLYQLSKFTKRNKALVGGVAASFLLLVLGVVGTAIGLAWALSTKADLESVNGVLEQANADLETANANLANANAALERTNADLEAVASFQENQLAGVDPSDMGAHQRAWLLDAIVEEQREPLDATLETINFTDAARATLDENILAPSIEAIDTEFADRPVIQGRLLRAVSRTRRKLGLYDAAEAPAMRALELHDALSGLEAEETVRTIEDLALLRLDQGLYDDAERLYRRRLQLAQQLRADDDPLIPMAEIDLAVALRAKGDIIHAEEAVRTAIERLEPLVEPADPMLLSAQNTHGAILVQLERHQEAIELRRKVADTRRAALGDDDPLTLIAIHNLAITLGGIGEIDEAEALLREELELCARVHGNDHPRTLSATTGLAWVLLQANRYREAEPLYRDALARYRELLGEEHPSAVATLNNLASALDSQGKFEEAEPLYRRSLEINQRVLGEDHPRTLMGIGNLGYVLNKLGRPEEAEPLYRASLDAFRRTRGDDHPSTLNAMGNLGSLLLTLDKTDEARALLTESYENRLRVLGPEHALTLNGMYNLGDMLIDLGELDEAEPLCTGALEGYSQIHGEDHLGALHSLMLVGNLRMKQERHGDAIPLFREAVDRRSRVLGDEHPDTLVSRQRLREAMEAQQNN